MNSSHGSALVGSVAQALNFAIQDPKGHLFNNSSSCTSACRASRCNSTAPSLHSRRVRGLQKTRQAALVFDSSAIPPIGIDKYLNRLFATFRCSDAAFIAALIVVDRLLQYDGGRLPLTMRNVHRVFLASLVVAVKYHEDLVYTNSHYAKAGGVHLREVNRLERVLLAALDFDLRVHPEEYRLYEACLLAMCGPSQAPGFCVVEVAKHERTMVHPTEAVAPVEGTAGAKQLVTATEGAFNAEDMASAAPVVPQKPAEMKGTPETVASVSEGSNVATSASTSESDESRAVPSSSSEDGEAPDAEELEHPTPDAELEDVGCGVVTQTQHSDAEADGVVQTDDVVKVAVWSDDNHQHFAELKRPYGDYFHWRAGAADITKGDLGGAILIASPGNEKIAGFAHWSVPVGSFSKVHQGNLDVTTAKIVHGCQGPAREL